MTNLTQPPKPTTYRLWFALSYEVTNILINNDTKWEVNRWVRLVRAHSFIDWVEWKTERSMEILDEQIEDIRLALEAEDRKQYIDPIIIHHAPDGSRAQELLGGEIQIKAPWVDGGLQKQ